MNDAPRIFYEKAYQDTLYSPQVSMESHPVFSALLTFVERYDLWNKDCLEVGTGRGAFQNLTRHYIGIDMALSAHRYVNAPFAAASVIGLPFPTASFDGIWTINVLEHVLQPERGLLEMWRVLKPGGHLFLAPAWQCRPWAAQGFPVRPYCDFDWRGKLIKASIPLRNSFIYRSLKIFPLRLVRLLQYKVRRQPTIFRYRELIPNYEQFWMSDSDAVNSMDAFDAYLWHVSRGAICANYPSLSTALLIRNGPLIFRKPVQGS